ncbi:hypothetical protein KFE98_04680 [bacterium SCSIO 12741]|nr:hypothetical protein KFE98_04680 [bacterium SCSIO 12741]
MLNPAMGNPKSYLSLGFLILCLSLSSIGQAQSDPVYLNRDYEWQFQKAQAKKSLDHHDAIKPYLHSDFTDDDSVRYRAGFPMRWSREENDDRVANSLAIYPLLRSSFMYDASTESDWQSQLGIGVGAGYAYKDLVSFRINASAHRVQYPLYLRTRTEQMGVVPEGEVWHRNHHGYHYVDINGYLSFNAGKHFNFQVGHGKNFIGNGYRSMLLSDQAGNATYGKITTSIWRLKYVILYSAYKDINQNESRKYSDFLTKYSTTHYLSWNLTKWLNVGFFESVVWRPSDTLVERGFDVNYLNPVIFLRPVEFSTGSSDNSLLGMNLAVKPADKFQVYGQFIIDEFIAENFFRDISNIFKQEKDPEAGWWGNKYAWQLGVKTFDVFGVKGLGFQTECNLVRPFSYSHSNPTQNYGHMNSSLAHPRGANLVESISFVNYQKKNWFFEAYFQFMDQGLSTDTINYGEDIYRSYADRENEYGHFVGQGVQTQTVNAGIRASYLIYPINNLRLFSRVNYRWNYHWGTPTQQSMQFEIGLSSRLFNRYYDI